MGPHFKKQGNLHAQISQNSPEAAARVVALTLIADGDVDRAELALLEEIAVHEQLGLTRDGMHAVIDTFCEDLLSTQQLAWADRCPVDAFTLTFLMGEIDEPKLRRKVLGLCVRLAKVNGHIAAGESIVLAAASEHWRLAPGL